MRQRDLDYHLGELAEIRLHLEDAPGCRTMSLETTRSQPTSMAFRAPRRRNAALSSSTTDCTSVDFRSADNAPASIRVMPCQLACRGGGPVRQRRPP